MIFTYARVSRPSQVEEGESLEDQQRRTSARAFELGGLASHAYVEKAVSGSKPFAQRPEGALLDQALQPGDIVIATKLDRMFRDAGDAHRTIQQFDQRGISLYLLDLGKVSGNGNSANAAIQRLIVQILAAVAQFERERTIERIRDVKETQRQRGAWLGGKRLFGWRRDRQNATWVEDPDEQAIHALVHQLRTLTPPRSYTEISDQVLASYGIRLGKSTIAGLLKRLPHQRPVSC